MTSIRRFMLNTTPWRRLTVHAVGGLTEVGFTPDGRHLLVISVSGRGLIDVVRGQRVARDTEEPRLDSSWLHESRHAARGIGPAAHVTIDVVGLWGGHPLPTTTTDGWTVRVRRVCLAESVVLRREGSFRRWILDRPVTELRAVGFSQDGGVLVIATSSDVALYTRAGSSQ